MFFRRMFARGDSSSNSNMDDIIDDVDDNNNDDDDEAKTTTTKSDDTNNNNHHSRDYEKQRHRHRSGEYHQSTAAPSSATQLKRCISATTLHRTTTGSAATVVQLTPLWEHVLRTRTLPDTTCPIKMFGEFLERLRDPEWQVRQHALRVLVDVLVVMRSKADPYMDVIVPQLVENLGHPAPTVRKGALDCLRVYLAETAEPDTIMLQILDIGLNQRVTSEPFGGRLTCGVMLSIPALVQSTLHTAKRHFILSSTIDILTQKMAQFSNQEITLKVLAKMRELIGNSEFIEYMSHDAYCEFQLLCNVYGINKNVKDSGSSSGAGGSWSFMSQAATIHQNGWRSSQQDDGDEKGERDDEVEQILECASGAKVIMETEIKINDDTVTMRILEAKDDTDETETDMSPHNMNDDDKYLAEDEVVCGRLMSAQSVRNTGAVLQLLSDSDDGDSGGGGGGGVVDDGSGSDGSSDGKMNTQKSEEVNEYYTTIITPSTPSRTPKRVTFGGEVVKMRTPDSDASSMNNNKSNSDNMNGNQNQNENISSHSPNILHIEVIGGGNGEDSGDAATTLITRSTSSTSDSSAESKTTILSVEITNDNTKPLIRPKSAQSSPEHRLAAQTYNTNNSATSTTTTTTTAAAINTNTSTAQYSPIKRHDSSASLSPNKSPFKRINISPVDSIISPKAPHKEIEVLHNLQRDPSPVRARSARRTSTETTATTQEQENRQKAFKTDDRLMSPSAPPKTWEDLDIVSDDTLMDLRSGDWRLRLQGVLQLEEALRTSDNLAIVLPCLDSLLRTLLSSERNAEVAEEKRHLLINLITRLPLDNLEERTVQIMNGLCRQGGAGANRACKALMQRLPPATIVLKLISDEFLHAKSSRFREHALQMVMYALMTFPSTCFDTTTCITNAVYAALNRKRRVRQAALDVLAILGQISTPRAVMDVVQSIAVTRDDGDALVAAVKTLLSRKQLPLVTADGSVQYTLRVPSSPHSTDDAANNDGDSAVNGGVGVNSIGPDIEWITAGVGSVSPTSLKRRAYRNRSYSQQSFRCLPQQQIGMGMNMGMAMRVGPLTSASGSNNSDEGITRKYSFRSPPEMCGNVRETTGNGYHHLQHNYHHHHQNHHQQHIGDDNHSYKLQHMLGNSVPIMHYGSNTKKSNADYTNYISRRLVAKSCSDSSMDGRSTDSTHTSSSGGSGSGGGGGGVHAAGGDGVGYAHDNAPIVTATINNTNGGDISGRFTRQVNSRFPTMERMDLNTTYMRVHKPPTYYPGMGAYAHLQQQQLNMNSTYPKINYTLPAHQRRRLYQPQQQQQQQQQPQKHIVQGNFNQKENLNKEQNNTSGNLDGTYTISTDITVGSDVQTTKFVQQNQTIVNGSSNNNHNNNNNNNGIGRRFVNVEKFIMQSNKSSQTNGVTTIGTANIAVATPATAATTTTVMETLEQEKPDDSTTTPTASLKSSSTYSQKSTASAKSNKNTSNNEIHNEMNDATSAMGEKIEIPMAVVATATATTTSNENANTSPNKGTTGEEVLKIEDVTPTDVATLPLEYAIDEVEEEQDTIPKRKGSMVSLKSKTESIHTPKDDETAIILSRTQSAKSLVIEEDIVEKRESFHLIDENKGSGNATDSVARGRSDINGDSPPSRPYSRQRSPTIAELKTLSRNNSINKSMESLYQRPSATCKPDSLDNSTETSSQSSLQINSILPLKQSQHTPLKQKSKTTHFLRNNRRISPVKQSIKMVQAELYPPTMQKFEKPRDALLKAFDQLDSSNWEVIIVGLKSMVRLMRYHPEHLENQMHMVCIQLTRSVRNLRSQVARAACQASTELFSLKSKYLEQECDDLVCALLHRTADTNRFLRADATRSLESMCDNLTPTKILNILTTKGALHQNALVRTTTAKLLTRLVERLGYDKVYTMARENRDKFFLTGANLLLEGSLETRSYAKSMFRQLSEHSNYNRMILEIIPQRIYRNVEKTLKNITR